MKSVLGVSLFLFGLMILGVAWGPATPIDFWIQSLAENRAGHSFDIFRDGVLELRVVHVLLASATGFALATAGRAMQQLLQNPLADPHVVGISAGSTTAVLLTILFAPSFAQVLLGGFLPALWVSAVIGATISLFLLRMVFLRVARRWGATSLALAGLFLNAGFSALLMVIFARLSPAGLSEVQSWTLGAIQPYSLNQALVLLPPLLFSAVYILRCERHLMLMSFGHDFALSNGVDVSRLRTRVLVALAVLSASAVCAAGSVGFVGLLVPHLTRRWMYSVRAAWHRPLFNGISGACVLVFADVLSRTLTPPTELPVGVYTAVLSIPFLFAVFMRGGRSA